MDKTTWRGSEEDLDDWIAMQKHEGSMGKVSTIKRTTLEPVTQPIAPTRTPVAGNLPRCFLLYWDNSKVRARKVDQDRAVKRECYGVKFPNGRVSLDFGSGFESMTHLLDHIAEFGDYTVTWLSGEDE